MECFIAGEPQVWDVKVLSGRTNTVTTWIERDMPVFYTTQTPDMSEYRNYINETYGGPGNADPFDQIQLLKRQQAVSESVFPMFGDPNDWQLIIDEEIKPGLQPITCIEAILFLQQDAYFPFSEFSAEMGAHLLKRDGEVQFFVQHGPFCGVQPFPGLDEEIDRQIQNGWEYSTFIHNHPFSGNANSLDIAGTCIPSSPDIQTISSSGRLSGLQEAWIPNGLDTLHMTVDQVEKFSSYTAPTPAPPADPCTNTCSFAYDGDCDDGGPGSDYFMCDFGTDCADCGVRGPFEKAAPSSALLCIQGCDQYSGPLEHAQCFEKCVQ